MSRVARLHPEFVQFIPDELEPGVIYISRRYATASHLCCCGCGLRVVTPLNPAKWHLTERGDAVSLHPSIGNWSFPCKSHYWIDGNSVRWAGAMSAAAIAEVRARDRYDAERLSRIRCGLIPAIWGGVQSAWRKVIRVAFGWWR